MGNSTSTGQQQLEPGFEFLSHARARESREVVDTFISIHHGFGWNCDKITFARVFGTVNMDFID
jgi:hypothetical protein